MAEVQQDSHSQPQQTGQAQAGQVDIKLLAEKVYRLMLAEARLSNARGAALSHRKRGK